MKQIRALLASRIWLIAIWGAACLFMSQPGCGFFLILALPVFLLYQLLASLFSRTHRAHLGISVAILVGGAMGTGLSQLFWAHHFRQEANQISHAIEGFYSANGRYPESLAEIGFEEHPRTAGHVMYHPGRGGESPFTMYSDTWLPFDIWFYNFSTKTWDFLPD